MQGMSGKEKCNLVKQCILKLSEINVFVVTSDGPQAHLSMMNLLGATMNSYELDPTFTHPGDSTLKIDVLLDPCHMLKLIRNTSEHYSIIKDADGNIVNYK